MQCVWGTALNALTQEGSAEQGSAHRRNGGRLYESALIVTLPAYALHRVSETILKVAETIQNRTQ